MKSEDYISQDAGLRARPWRPFPRKHLIGITSTLLIAVSAAMVIQSHSTARRAFTPDHDDPAVTALPPTSGDVLDPAVSLTEAFKSEIVRPGAEIHPREREVKVAVDTPALDNFDDTLTESELADSDEALSRELTAKADQDAGGADTPAAAGEWQTETVAAGASLSSVFADLNLSPATVQAVVAASPRAETVHPGDRLAFLIDERNRLHEFVRPYGRGQQQRFYRDPAAPDRFLAAVEPVGAQLQPDGRPAPATAPAIPKKPAATPRPRSRLVVATVRRGEAFSTAARRAGVSYAEINQILKLFRGRIQFSRNIYVGDTMRVLYTAPGNKGRIAAVEFTLARGGKLAAYLNPRDGKFYDERGLNSTRGTFRRFPLNGDITVSSPFNPRRRHPVLGYARPHNGTDFAVRVGTPVVSPADGVVSKVGYSNSAGHYLVIRHRGAYSTVYMHLSSVAVRQDQAVKLGAIIARSGNTGMSTGPHLHYELRIDGRPVNAMRVDLGRAAEAQIDQRERKRFTATVRTYKQDLYNQRLLAQNP